MWTERLNDMLRVSSRWIAGIAAAIIVVFGLMSVARVGHMFWVYHQLNGWVTTNLGVDSTFAMFLAVAGTAVIILLLPSVLWYALSGRRVRDAAIVAVGCAGVVALLVNTVGRDVCFDRASGRPLCYVAETPDGLQFSRTPGVHPKYGVAFVVYTQEMALARGNQEQAARREAPRVEPIPTVDTTYTLVARSGQPARISVPIGWRWDMVGTIPSGWATDNGYRDARGNRIQVFEVVPPATEVTLQIRIAKCTTVEGCGW